MHTSSVTWDRLEWGLTVMVGALRLERDRNRQEENGRPSIHSWRRGSEQCEHDEATGREEAARLPLIENGR